MAEAQSAQVQKGTFAVKVDVLSDSLTTNLAVLSSGTCIRLECTSHKAGMFWEAHVSLQPGCIMQAIAYDSILL